MQTVAQKTENSAKSTTTKVPFFGGESSPFFQPKLTVNQPGDKYEKEADAVAGQVMRMPAFVPSAGKQADAPVAQRMGITPFDGVQRTCAPCEQEDGTAPDYSVMRSVEDEEQEVQAMPEATWPAVQRMCTECAEENEIPVQKKGDSFGGQTAPPIVSSVLSAGGGRPLDSGVKRFMESRMGMDFSGVRIHTDTRAAESARSIQAKAYTSGNQIVFGQGEYRPETSSGKYLLAHELTHVGQQSGGVMRQEATAAEAPPAAPESSGQQAPAEGSATPVCPNVPDTQPPAEVVTGGEPTEIPNNGQAAQKPVPAEKQPESAPAAPQAPAPVTEAPVTPQQPAAPTQTPQDPKEDPAFGGIVGDTRRAKDSQEQHDAEASKVTNAEASAENPAEKDAQMAEAGKVLGIDQSLQDAPFDKEAFKRQVLFLVNKEIPRNESANKQFQQDGGAKLNKLGAQHIDNGPNPQKDIIENPDNPPVAASETTGHLYQKEVTDLTPENPGRKVAVGEVDRAIPKPHTDTELALDKEHDAESLDRAMEDENLKEFNAKLTENQLSESNEPQFKEALSIKKEEQAKLCQVPSDLRQKETEMRESAGEKAQKDLQAAMAGKHGQRKDQFGQIANGKEETKKKDEVLLENYYKKIAGIFDNVKKGVDEILKNLDETVPEIFGAAVTKANNQFKSRVKSRLDDYYGVGITNLSEEDEDEAERSYNKPFDKRIVELNKQKQQTEDTGRIAQLNQQIEAEEANRKETIPDRVFKQEKEKFVTILDLALDEIAGKVEEAMKNAKALIAQGKADIDCASACLPANLQKEAEERTNDFKSRFDDLETTVNDKQKELAQSLAREYSKNVTKLKETFEEIRKESAMSWWERAWNAIKKIALMVYELGKLLVKVLVKGASVIGDIVAHPIRFIGNLITAVGNGFRNFVTNIDTHLENIIFKLILGTVPPGIKFPAQWDAKGILSFALELLGLTRENIRAQAVARLGEPVVQQLEKAFELFVIFKNEGFAGLWEHIKEKIGDLKAQVIKQVKAFFRESIIKAAVKFLLSALTPASGFIKACETIINVAMFFIKNLENILKLLDSILDSFIDIAQGNLTSASKRVEDALADILLIGIKFLASLVGINLESISEKVQRVFNAIRNPVNRAITWLIDKAVAFAEKTGLVALAKKGKEKFEQGKEWAMEKGRQAAGAVAGWLGLRKEFTLPNGERHEIYFEGSDRAPIIMVASRPKGIEQLIADRRSSSTAPALTQAQNNALTQALSKKSQLDHFINSHRSTSGETETLSPQIDSRLNAIKQDLIDGDAIPVSPDLPLSNVTYAKDGGRAKRVIARPLTKLPGNTRGSRPIQGNDSIPLGWHHIRAVEGDNIRMWVKAHLLNENLHGPGEESWNLAPGSQRLNAGMRGGAEKWAKDEIAKDEIIHYKAEISSWHIDNSNPAVSNYFPSSLTITYGHMPNPAKGRTSETTLTVSYTNDPPPSTNVVAGPPSINNMTRDVIRQTFRGVANADRIYEVRNSLPNRSFRDLAHMYLRLREAYNRSEDFENIYWPIISNKYNFENAYDFR